MKGTANVNVAQWRIDTRNETLNALAHGVRLSIDELEIDVHESQDKQVAAWIGEQIRINNDIHGAEFENPKGLLEFDLSIFDQKGTVFEDIRILCRFENFKLILDKTGPNRPFGYTLMFTLEDDE